MVTYRLEEASEKDISRLISYKLDTILEYAKNIDEKEKNRILKYVSSEVTMKFNSYQLIIVEETIVGSFLLEEKEEFYFLDEIYLEKDYRNKGIGKSILKKIISSHDTIYLWVYQSNQKAISLYKKLGFQVVDKTATRFYMQYDKK